MASEKQALVTDIEALTILGVNSMAMRMRARALIALAAERQIEHSAKWFDEQGELMLTGRATAAILRGSHE